MKITTQDILEWHGDHDIDELAEYICCLLNGDLSLQAAKEEILEYVEKDSEEEAQIAIVG